MVITKVITINYKFRGICKNHQAEKSEEKCLDQLHSRTMRVGFEL